MFRKEGQNVCPACKKHTAWMGVIWFNSRELHVAPEETAVCLRSCSVWGEGVREENMCKKEFWEDEESVGHHSDPTGTPHPSLPSHTAAQRSMSHSSISYLLLTVCFSLYLSSGQSVPLSAHEQIFHSQWALKVGQITPLFSAHKV